VVDAFDFDTNNCIALERAQQYPAEGITYRQTEAGLQGTEFKLTLKFRGFLKNDFVGFLKA
jgi:hypothetical protein